MTQQEFEQRIGTEVATSTFDFANRVYMAAGEMDKDSFCADWKQTDLTTSKIVSYLTQAIEDLKGALHGALQLQDDLSYFIADMAHLAFSGCKIGQDLRRKAVEVLGRKAYLKYILASGYGLEQYDREDLINILEK
jgi:hypothetical protein